MSTSTISKNQTGLGIIVVIILVVVVAAIAVGAFYLGTKNNSQPTAVPNTYAPVKTAAPSSTATSSASPSASVSPSVNPTMLENIKASIVSKNTAALEGYMTEPVQVIIEATECCGMLSRANAIKEMDYLNDATLPWNFDDNNPIAAQLRAKNPTAFPVGSIIGTSANRYLVTFTLTADKTKIEKVYMAVDYKLHGI